MKIFTHICIAIFMSLGINQVALVQNSIQGIVIDAQTKAPMPGVNVSVAGSKVGTVTDQKGRFMLHTSHNLDTLIFSFVGYEHKTIVPTQETVIVNLLQSYTALDQVVISANRGEQKRSDVPMAISKISSQTLNEAKPVTLDQVLNKVSGVYMISLGNEQHSMSIRQPLSYKSLFLYLEDGIPIRPTGVFNYNALIEMNMAGVQDIEVIKGPASSIYGSEAIGGAINFITQSDSCYSLFEGRQVIKC